MGRGGDGRAGVKRIRRAEDLTPDARNANRGTPRGRELLGASLRQYGAGRSIVVDRAGRILAGNKTLAQARALDLPVETVQTEGERLVVVQRVDLDLDTDVRARQWSGKTFGLVRRVERILHPEGLAVDGKDVLVVAFNWVIAGQFREDIGARLKTFEHTHDPVIRTIHALCVEVIGEELRMLLPHEVDAMVYDVLHLYPAVAKLYANFRHAQQALRDHEAGHKEHHELWQGSRQWLIRHKAHLVSDLPRLLLARLKGGDFPEQGYDFVIVDEFQDLTAGEQDLMFRLRRPGGQLVALGNPRQSIYMFRGNDRQGLAKLKVLVGEGNPVTDVAITECQRCPEPIVVAANKLMALSGVDAMVPVSETEANIHVVTWKTPEAEAAGMAKFIVENIHAHPKDRHLAMVTRRRFGYWRRDVARFRCWLAHGPNS